MKNVTTVKEVSQNFNLRDVIESDYILYREMRDQGKTHDQASHWINFLLNRKYMERYSRETQEKQNVSV